MTSASMIASAAMTATTALPYHMAPVIATTGGKVQGYWQTGSSAAYLGIPFAAAPVGPRRFAAPASPEPWDGVRPAMAYGPTPQRRPFGSPIVTIPEPSIPGDSTLNVNVFTPAPNDRDARLPVYVWIHGGGYFAGSPASPWYNGRAFNASGVVTVTISYRLGFEGFGWMEGASLNRGLLDQIAALEWVRDNIVAFGGDPDRVTIGGQSAGGGSVLALLASPRARGLFRGAISESGAFGTPTVEQAVAGGRALAERIGVEPTREAWLTVDPETILDNEREVNHAEGVPGNVVDADSLIDALRGGSICDNGMIFVPVADGDVLPETQWDAFRNGMGSDVALFMGSNRNEFSFPTPGGPSLDDVCATLAKAGISEESIRRFTNGVLRIGEDRVAGQFVTAWTFRVGLAYLAAVRARLGAGSRTWAYDFAQMSSISNVSAHCEEIPYAFNLLDAENVTNVLGAGASQPLADAMHDIWVRFIADGSLDSPSADDNDACGALRFQGGGASYDADAYRFEHEVLSAAGVL